MVIGHERVVARLGQVFEAATACTQDVPAIGGLAAVLLDDDERME